MVSFADTTITGPGRIDSRTLDLVRALLADYPEITGAYLFGSRAKGNARRASDVDLALRGVGDRLRIEAIRSELEELPLPFRFDVVVLEASPTAT